MSYCKHLMEGLLDFVGAGMVKLEEFQCSHYPQLKSLEVESMSSSVGEHLLRLDLSGWDVGDALNLDEHGNHRHAEDESADPSAKPDKKA